MNTLNLSLTDLESPGYIAQIGFVGENECTQVVINCSDVFYEYPTALPSLTVKAPNRCEPYPSIVERNDFSVVWTVTNANLAEEGVGEFQLTFTVSNVVKKSYTGKYRVKKSLMPTGPIPDPLDDFITRAGALISEIDQVITDTIVATVPGWARQTSKPNYTAEEVGALPDNTFIPTKVSDLTDDSGHYRKPANGIPASDLESGIIQSIDEKANRPANPVNGHLATLDVMGNLIDSGKYPFDYILASQRGAVNGVAELDPNGRVPASQLPSFVDDVLEYATASSLPRPGEAGKIYVVKDTNATYRWSGSTYVEVGSSLALGETSSTAYRGDRGAIAYEHSSDSARLRTATPNGFFKIGATDEGHVSSLLPVTKQDLVSLGLASSNNPVFTGDMSLGRKEGTSVGYAGSVALGYNTEASGSSAFACGSQTAATGDRSFAEGSGTISSGFFAHAEGDRTEASFGATHAEGVQTRATALAAHAEGYHTEANGQYSHSQGYYTVASGLNQSVSGKYNVVDEQQIYAEIVGNGQNASSKSNARSLDWNGNERLRGNLYVECEPDGSGGKEVLTVDDMPVASVAETTRIIIEYGVNT